jgi:hypothetical protein
MKHRLGGGKSRRFAVFQIVARRGYANAPRAFADPRASVRRDAASTAKTLEGDLVSATGGDVEVEGVGFAAVEAFPGDGPHGGVVCAEREGGREHVDAVVAAP